jgi:Zn finger protein HypA/HybF involved in hydrogenase expression
MYQEIIKGHYMGDEFKIECHECGELTYVQAESLPEYCPMCGRRTEAESIMQDEEVLYDE